MKDGGDGDRCVELIRAGYDIDLEDIGGSDALAWADYLMQGNAASESVYDAARRSREEILLRRGQQSSSSS